METFCMSDALLGLVTRKGPGSVLLIRAIASVVRARTWCHQGSARVRRLRPAAAGHAPKMSPDYRLEVDRAGDTAVATLAGELDMAATFRLEPELERLTRGAGVDTLVLDVSGVEFMDSAALGLLIQTQQRLQGEGIRFLLANPPAGIQRILDVTGAGNELSVTPW